MSMAPMWALWLDRLFQVLNTQEDLRNKNLDEDLNKFPYINGDLFTERLPTTDFTAAMRETLLEACRFNWSAVSPAIFGSLFQSVMDAKERRKKGAHYTTEKNILKVIGPLFLDDLKAEFAEDQEFEARAGGELEAFRRRLGNADISRPGLRLRQFSDYFLPRTADAGTGRAAGTEPGGPARPWRGDDFDAGRRPVLRHRVRGVPRPHCGSGDVDDGPHHE